LAPHLLEHTGRVSATSDIPVYSSSRSGLTPQGEYFDGSNLQNSGEYSVVPDGYITYRHMSDDGIFKFNQNQTGGSIAVSKEYPVFATSDMHPHFLLNLLNNSWDFKRFALSQKKGGTRTRLYLSVLKTWNPLLPPSEAEQQKIADFLSSLDELIAAETDKLAATRDHKEGLMRHLFPAEGEAVPRLRLPEFQGSVEWETSKLEEVVLIQSGSTPSKANPEFWNGSIPWVSAKDMKQLFLDDTEDHISTIAANNGTRLAPEGSLLVLTRGMTLLKDIPICILRREMAYNQDVKALRPKAGVNGIFLAFALLASKRRLLDAVDIAGHGTGKIDTDELEKFELAFPRPPEQQKIVEFLLSAHEMLNIQLERVAKLQSHKQALIQQLFPSQNDASA